MTWPLVSVVIATRNRPDFLQLAIKAVWKQDYPGPIELIVVFDQTPPQERSSIDSDNSARRRSQRILVNTRTPGLAGARNTGILASSGALVAFCDDDDAWFPEKLRLQVEALKRHNAIACVTGIEIHYGRFRVLRVPALDTINLSAVTQSRLTGAHPSTYLISRQALISEVGLVDEALPFGYGEDYDLLIRITRCGAIAVVRAPLVTIIWHEKSFFTRRWEAMEAGVGYLLEKHHEISANRKGRAWIEGQRSFAQAALGRRRSALKSAWLTMRLNPAEPRALLAALVALRLVSADKVLDALNRRGRGI